MPGSPSRRGPRALAREGVRLLRTCPPDGLQAEDVRPLALGRPLSRRRERRGTEDNLALDVRGSPGKIAVRMALSRRLLIRMRPLVQVQPGPPQRHDRRKQWRSSTAGWVGWVGWIRMRRQLNATDPLGLPCGAGLCQFSADPWVRLG